MTVFVTGDSYLESPTAFSTRTTIVDMASGKQIGQLEQFKVTKDGKPFDAVDFNFWGVTFDPRDSEPLLRDPGHRRPPLPGRRQHRASESMTVLRDGVECPSLSPDGKQIAYKSRIGNESRWRLRVLDVATLEDHAGRRGALDRRPGRVARRRHARLLRRDATSTPCRPTAAAPPRCLSATRLRPVRLIDPGKYWPVRSVK